MGIRGTVAGETPTPEPVSSGIISGGTVSETGNPASEPVSQCPEVIEK